jgi:hypothetical protein
MSPRPNDRAGDIPGGQYYLPYLHDENYLLALTSFTNQPTHQLTN